MNILIISHTHGYGGVERQVLMLAQGLCQLDHLVWVATPEKSWLAHQCRAAGINLLATPLRGLYDLRSHWQLVRAVRRNRIDVVHGHARRSAFYSAVAGRLTGTLSIATVHSLYTWKQFNLNRKIIAVSNAVRDFLLTKGIEQRQISVVYNGVSSPELADIESRHVIRESFGIQKEDLLVGMSGRTVRHKGHDLLILAIQQLIERYPSLKIVIIGENSGEWYEQLVKMVAAHSLENTVKFLGYQQDVSRIIQIFDVFVLPSRAEALSLSLIEAISVGLPVIASRVGGVPEVVTHKEDGLLFTTEDPTSLAECIAELCGSEALRARLGAAARQNYLDKFTAQTMTRKTLEVYRQHTVV